MKHTYTFCFPVFTGRLRNILGSWERMTKANPRRASTYKYYNFFLSSILLLQLLVTNKLTTFIRKNKQTNLQLGRCILSSIFIYVYIYIYVVTVLQTNLQITIHD